MVSSQTGPASSAHPASQIPVFCPECGAQAILSPDQWRCSCGGAWETEELTTFDPDLIETDETSIWRYLPLFNVGIDRPAIRMGAGWTPLLPADYLSHEVLVKPEYFAPTGSFKDRGTELMMNILFAQGVSHVVEASSGNAGASVAAYAARAGIQAEIFVPAYASPVKQAQISIYGANVRPIPGPRKNAKLAAFQALDTGAIFASHAYHPGFLLGQQSVAWEVWEQLGRKAPDWYVVPVGQGVHLLGVWLGFRRLFRAGLVDRIPKIVAVQPALLAPVCQAYKAGLDTVPEIEPVRKSLAEDLAIAGPVRGKRILQAIRDSGGFCVTVEEGEILEAQRELARRGFYAEPTSATVAAALPAVFMEKKPSDLLVLPLTGSGLKGTPVLSVAR